MGTGEPPVPLQEGRRQLLHPAQVKGNIGFKFFGRKPSHEYFPRAGCTGQQETALGSCTGRRTREQSFFVFLARRNMEAYSFQVFGPQKFKTSIAPLDGD